MKEIICGIPYNILRAIQKPWLEFKSIQNKIKKNIKISHSLYNWRPIGFWPIFSFWRIKLIFGRPTCFDRKSIVPLFFGRFALHSPELMYAKTNSVLLLNEKQKKPFVLLSFITRIITLISYCCFISASDLSAQRDRREFVLSWHRFNTRSVIFFSFLICLPTYFKTKTSITTKMCCRSH